MTWFYWFETVKDLHRGLEALITELRDRRWADVQMGPMDSAFASILGLWWRTQLPEDGEEFRQAFEDRLRRREIEFAGVEWTAAQGGHSG
uniref:Uncharacterized protein n=1 Tax=viral metagenome TaxID=1070528 RepID=A0A6M3M0M7_9ZZZZ